MGGGGIGVEMEAMNGAIGFFCCDEWNGWVTFDDIYEIDEFLRSFGLMTVLVYTTSFYVSVS